VYCCILCTKYENKIYIPFSRVCFWLIVSLTDWSSRCCLFGWHDNEKDFVVCFVFNSSSCRWLFMFVQHLKYFLLLLLHTQIMMAQRNNYTAKNNDNLLA